MTPLSIVMPAFNEAEHIEQFHHITPESIERVRTDGNIGCAVPACVVAQDPEMTAEGSDLSVPHVQVGADGVREQENRKAGGAVEAVCNPNAVARVEKVASGFHGSLPLNG